MNGSSTPLVMLVLDGMGDRAYAELGGLSPVEAADTPNLDALAALGACGTMYPLEPGYAPSSHQAHFALFGYDPAEFPGRGLLEALGSDMPPAHGEVVLRANLARVTERDGSYHIEERPDPREGEAGLDELDLDDEIDGVRIRFVHTDHLQGLLYLSSAHSAISHHISDADPLRADMPVLAVCALEEASDPAAAEHTARVLNEWMRRTHRRLRGRELDFVLVKWAGAHASITPFAKRFGLRGVCLGAGVLYRGLALAVGMEHVEIPATAGPAEDLSARVERALALLEQGHDFIHVHSKWPDMRGHRKDPGRKRDVLSELDTALGPLVELARKGVVVSVLADHQTPSAGPLYHGGAAVPLVIAGGVSRSDPVTSFGESMCAGGSLGVLRGRDVLPLMLDAADRSAFLADRMTPHLALGVPRPEDLVRLNAEDPGF